MDSGALHCCSRNLKEDIRGSILDFDPSASMGEKLTDHRKRMAEKKRLKKEEGEKKREKRRKLP